MGSVVERENNNIGAEMTSRNQDLKLQTEILNILLTQYKSIISWI